MGFSKPRAEEALRQMGANRVESAMEWLFSHLEEVQEDDELARTLAMSLGSGAPSTDENDTNVVSAEQDGEMVQLPPVDELLSTYMRLLQVKEPLAFPVRDFLVMICSRNDGQERSKVISFIIDHVKLCDSISGGNGTMLSALFHVLALVLHEDTVAREVASTNGFVAIASDLLSQWNPSTLDGDKLVPKWVTAAILAIDKLLQVDPKINSELLDPLKKDERNNREGAIVIEEDKQKDLQSSSGLGPLNINLNEQKKLIEIACRCIISQLPSETMHVGATLTLIILWLLIF